MSRGGGSGCCCSCFFTCNPEVNNAGVVSRSVVYPVAGCSITSAERWTLQFCGVAVHEADCMQYNTYMYDTYSPVEWVLDNYPGSNFGPYTTLPTYCIWVHTTHSYMPPFPISNQRNSSRTDVNTDPVTIRAVHVALINCRSRLHLQASQFHCG